jgi:hypothetical protein
MGICVFITHFHIEPVSVATVVRLPLFRVEPSPLLLWRFIGLLYQSWMIVDVDCRAISGMNDWQGNQNSDKTYHSGHHRSHT